MIGEIARLKDLRPGSKILEPCNLNQLWLVGLTAKRQSRASAMPELAKARLHGSPSNEQDRASTLTQTLDLPDPDVL